MPRTECTICSPTDDWDALKAMIRDVTARNAEYYNVAFARELAEQLK